MNDIYALRAIHVMNKDVVHTHPEDTIHDALILMEENRLSALPVADNSRRCVGFLSATDCIGLLRHINEGLTVVGRTGDVSHEEFLEKLTEYDLETMKVESRMTEAVASVHPETPLGKVAAEMLRHRVHHLPVVDDKGLLQGIVSTVDLLGVFAERAPEA